MSTETTPADAAWKALVEDRGREPSPREAFMAGWDSGLQQAAANPQPPGPQGGF